MIILVETRKYKSNKYLSNISVHSSTNVSWLTRDFLIPYNCCEKHALFLLLLRKVCDMYQTQVIEQQFFNLHYDFVYCMNYTFLYLSEFSKIFFHSRLKYAISISDFYYRTVSLRMNFVYTIYKTIT